VINFVSFLESSFELQALFIMPPGILDDSEDELDWEEVVVPEQQPLEITIQTGARPKQDAAVNKSV
jgi:xeroderma pigmentosum group C-complementing protein